MNFLTKLFVSPAGIRREVFLIALILVLVVVIPFYNPYFFRFANLKILLLANSHLILLAIGMGFLLIVGEIDLSMGSVLALAGVVSALGMKELGYPIPIAIAMGMAAAFVVGLVNAVFIVKIGVNFLIMTLATMGIVRGLVIVISEAGVAFLPTSFNRIGQSSFLGLATPVWVSLVLAVVLGVLLAQAQEKLKVGFINTGPKNDGGWTQGHWTGAEMLKKELGDKIEVTFIENVKEGPDAERAIEGLARAGNKLIFTTSFGFMDPTLKVAEKFPDVKFEHATGFKTAPNVTTYNARFYQGRYIIGQIAAKMSKAGVAGYIVSFPIPEVVMGINAFMLGAQTINPDFKLKIVWINTWIDPAKEADAAKALFDQGVDIIAQHTDSTAPLQIAQERGLHGFGQSHDMYEAAPKAQYTSIVDNWGPYYVARVKAALDGTWQSQASWDGLKEGTVVMAEYRNLPDDVVAMAKDTQAKITSGELHPFKGPIVKQDGTEVIPAGKALDDGAMLTMDYYVKGVDGEPGK